MTTLAQRLYRSGAIERETLHILDGAHRIALVETQTAGGAAQLVRYQHDDHLGSAVVELAEDAAPLSYEEFTPYGTQSLTFGSHFRRIAERIIIRLRRARTLHADA